MKTLTKSLLGTILIIGLVFALSTPITSYACSPAPDANYPTRQGVVDDGGEIFITKIINSGPIVAAEVLESTSSDTPSYVIMRTSYDSCSRQSDFLQNMYVTVVTPSENNSIINHSDLDSQFSYFYSTQTAAEAAYSALQNGQSPEPEEVTVTSTSVLGSHYIPTNYTLRPGMNNSDVAALQSGLNYIGAGLVADSLYGNGTKQAVMNFQNQNELIADGVAGSQTQQRLHERLSLTTN